MQKSTLVATSLPRLLGRINGQRAAGFKDLDEPPTAGWILEVPLMGTDTWENTKGPAGFFVPAFHLAEQNLPGPSDASYHKETFVLLELGKIVGVQQEASQRQAFYPWILSRCIWTLCLTKVGTPVIP